MKATLTFFLLILFYAGVFAQDHTLTVTIVESETGTGMTVIQYEFTGEYDVYDISAEVSFDNGVQYQSIPASHIIEGALENVAPGGPYTLLWNGGASFPNRFSDETIIRIGAASTTFTCGNDLTFTYRGSEVTYGTISKTYTIGARCWLDRNLGATQVATSSTDPLAYGDLFQWGRLDDGHQDRGSTTTSTQSSEDDPGHDDFIIDNLDWRSPYNNNLWLGVDGINNPCPPGWRVPTAEELEAELDSWGSNNSAGAYQSLKWPVGGHRNYGNNGELLSVNSIGYVWSSSHVKPSAAKILLFYDTNALMSDSYVRARGLSVRCVRVN